MPNSIPEQPKSYPMVENIFEGDPDFSPTRPRGLRYHTVDALGTMTTRVFYRANTPVIGDDGTRARALEALSARRLAEEQ